AYLQRQPKGEWQGDDLVIVALRRTVEHGLRVRQQGLLAVENPGHEHVVARPRQRALQRAAHPQVAVPDCEDALHFILAGRIEPLLLDAPGDSALLRLKVGLELVYVELAEVADHEMGTVGGQRLPITAALDTDDQPEPTAPPGLHPHGRILR